MNDMSIELTDEELGALSDWWGGVWDESLPLVGLATVVKRIVAARLAAVEKVVASIGHTPEHGNGWCLRCEFDAALRAEPPEATTSLTALKHEPDPEAGVRMAEGLSRLHRQGMPADPSEAST